MLTPWEIVGSNSKCQALMVVKEFSLSCTPMIRNLVSPICAYSNYSPIFSIISLFTLLLPVSMSHYLSLSLTLYISISICPYTIDIVPSIGMFSICICTSIIELSMKKYWHLKLFSLLELMYLIAYFWCHYLKLSKLYLIQPNNSDIL